MMDDQQLLRYSRHILLPQLDIAGQEKLLAARVMIVGLGGLGSPVGMYLAAAGVGELVLVDFDQVDLTNLQRQIIHTGGRVGINKAESAAQTLKALNPQTRIEVISSTLDENNIESLVESVDLVVDCSDNFTTRFLLNQVCHDQQTTLVSGAAIGFEGQITLFDFGVSGSPCYVCLYPDVDESQLTCSESGVLSPLVGVIGSMQALEVIKWITGAGETLAGRLLLFDALRSEWQELELVKDPDCPICGGKD